MRYDTRDSSSFASWRGEDVNYLVPGPNAGPLLRTQDIVRYPLGEVVPEEGIEWGSTMSRGAVGSIEGQRPVVPWGNCGTIFGQISGEGRRTRSNCTHLSTLIDQGSGDEEGRGNIHPGHLTYPRPR